MWKPAEVEKCSTVLQELILFPRTKTDHLRAMEISIPKVMVLLKP